MKYFTFTLLLLLAIAALGITQDLGQADRGRVHGGVMAKWGNIQSPTELSTASNTREYRPSVPRVILPGVRRLVPGEYPTIQAAIDASVDGDTVLISEGTYYENIRYKGKAIVVASMYLIDDDTTHIPLTIINGSNPSNPDSGSVVSFIDGEDTTSVLCGLTITGGTGTLYYYSPGHLWVREGGGVFCESSGARLFSNYIQQNRVIAQVAESGGLFAVGTPSIMPYLILEENRFIENYVQSDTTNLVWGNCGGAQLWGVQGRVVGNLFERDSAVGIVGASAGGLGVYSYLLGQSIEVYIQGNIFRKNYLHANQQGAVGAGLSAVNTGVVTIQENLFEENMAISVYGGWAEGGGMCISDQDLTTGYGRKYVMNNRFINNYVRCYNGWGDGGGVILYMTKATLSGNEVTGNTARGSYSYGGGLYAYESAFRLENNIFSDNYSYNYGGAILIEHLRSEQVIVNNTIYANEAVYYGGGMVVIGNASVLALNNILWANTAPTAPEIFTSGGVAKVRYSDVQGGHAGEGNISKEPMFRGENLVLSDSSSCIGAGILSYQVGSTVCYAPSTCFMGNPRPSPGGSNPDIGACESPREAPVVGLRPQVLNNLPKSYDLKQNYPNPFNPTTTIEFDLPKTSEVSLKVFNILGEEVTTLISDRLSAGSYTYEWDASHLASGVYLYRLEAEGFVRTRKMILMK